MKPKVWVVKGGWDYEGFEIVSVWAFESAANAAAVAVKRGYDYVCVDSYVVEDADETTN